MEHNNNNNNNNRNQYYNNSSFNPNNFQSSPNLNHNTNHNTNHYNNNHQQYHQYNNQYSSSYTNNNNNHLSLQQSKSAPSHFGTEFSNILGSINHELLDDFQIQLFQLLQGANDQNISSYFQKKSTILYRFLITLYIVSLDKTNPIRKNSNDELDLFNEFQNEFSHNVNHSDSFSVSSNSSFVANNNGYNNNYNNRTSVSQKSSSYNHFNNSQQQQHQQHPPPPQQPQYNEPQPPSAAAFFPIPINTNNNNNNNKNQSNQSNPVTPTKRSKHDESPSFGSREHSNPSQIPISMLNNNNSTFAAPNANVTFDVSKNAMPPNRQRAQSPRSNWQQHQQQNNNSQMNMNNNNNNNNNITNDHHQYQIKSKTQKQSKSDNNNNSRRRDTGSSFAKLSKSKSAQALKNVIKKKRLNELPHIGEEEESKEKTIFQQAAEIIAPMTIVRGKIRITNRTIAFIPDRNQPQSSSGKTNTENLALDPPNLEKNSSSSFERAQKQFRAGCGSDDKYWIAVNVASSYEQVGGTRYKLMNAKNVWTIDMITEIYYRRYQARNIAFELFFNDDTSWLFNVFTQKQRDSCFNSIIDLKPINLIDEAATFKNPKKAIKSSKIHHKWCTREISNFEYIMRINLLAGRTFNDLEQYPVVPWIIKDYESSEIDLKNPKIYRDLKKPMGAQNEERLKKFTERYELMQDDPNNKFMYGTHYSTKAIVLYYLIRMEPFTTYNKLFQGGKFDTADRLFDSIIKTWKGCMKSTSDVKELIPEFYYMTDFLQNKNKLNLGITQNGNKKVDYVILPPWAKGSYQIFTKTMRNAFESEYVSRNLHHWIDLIFGYKQIGKEAEKSYNVFHPYTYQDNIDLDKINDENEKEVILQIISEFGQTPMQIFKKPHRVRLKGTQVVQNIFKAKSIKYYGSFLCTESESHLGISYIAIRGKNVITISTDNTVDVHKFQSKTFSITKKNEKTSNLLSTFNRARGPSRFGRNSNKNDNNNLFGKNLSNLGNVKNQIIKKTSNHLFLKNLCFAVTMNGYYLFAAGFEDCSFIQYNISHERIEEQFHDHSNIVSCLALDENERKNKLILVTGSYDKSIIVWKGKHNKKKHNRSRSVNYSGNQQALELSLVYQKTKHESEINCIDISVEKGVIVVGTKTGTIYMYNSSKGDRLWSTTIKNEQYNTYYNIAICKVSKTFGTVCVYCCNYDNNPAKLYLYSNSGELLNQHFIAQNDKYHEITFSKSGNNVCCGGLNKSITIYNLPSFNIGRQLNDANDVIRHITTDKDEKYILSGLSNGNVLLYSYPESAQKITPKLPHRKSLYGVAGNQKKHTPFKINQ